MHRIFHMLHKLSIITYKEPIDGRFEDATAAILKDIYDSEEEEMKTTKPLKLMPMKKKTMKTTKPLKLMPMKKKTIVAK